MKLKSVHHIAVICSDYEKSKAFYTEVLGMEVLAERYRAERDFYIDIHEWPFPLAADNAALAANIRGFDEEKYRADVAAHHARLGSCETGHASEAAARRIMQVCGVTEKN